MATKQRELQERVQKWELDRSRDESEYLRKRESSKLVSKLEQMTQPQNRYEDFSNARSKGASNNCSDSQVVRTSSVLERSNPPNTRVSSDIQTPSKALAKESPSAFQVIIKSRALQQASSKGGMHFRNQLPANYTPTRSVAANHSSAQRGRADSSSASTSSLPETATTAASDRRGGGQATAHGSSERDNRDGSDESETDSPSTSEADELRGAHIAGTKFEAYYASYFQQQAQDRAGEAATGTLVGFFKANSAVLLGNDGVLTRGPIIRMWICRHILSVQFLRGTGQLILSTNTFTSPERCGKPWPSPRGTTECLGHIRYGLHFLSAFSSRPKATDITVVHVVFDGIGRAATPYQLCDHRQDAGGIGLSTTTSFRLSSKTFSGTLGKLAIKDWPN